VRGWWSGEIDGSTGELGAQFTYRYQDIHRRKQEITELIPGKRVAWHVLEGYLSFVADKTEWTGTDITFDIAAKGAGTEVRFKTSQCGPPRRRERTGRESPRTVRDNEFQAVPVKWPGCAGAGGGASRRTVISQDRAMPRH
jgi:hypothetical protein